MTKTLNQNTFTGEFSYSLDSKGRLNIPAKFRNVLSKKNKDSFGLELICGGREEPLKMLIQHAEIFYYNNNNT